MTNAAPAKKAKRGGLGRDEEYRLGAIIRSSEPNSSEWLAARNELFNGNMPLAKKIASDRFKYYRHCPGEDLMQIAYQQLLLAAEDFDPSFGRRFSTYAYKVIVFGLARIVAEDTAIIRITPHGREGCSDKNSPAAALIKRLIPRSIVGAPSPIVYDPEVDFLAADKAKEFVRDAISGFSERHQEIYCRGAGVLGYEREPRAKIAERFGVSAVRIGQIHNAVHDRVESLALSMATEVPWIQEIATQIA